MCWPEAAFFLLRLFLQRWPMSQFILMHLCTLPHSLIFPQFIGHTPASVTQSFPLNQNIPSCREAPNTPEAQEIPETYRIHRAPLQGWKAVNSPWMTDSGGSCLSWARSSSIALVCHQLARGYQPAQGREHVWLAPKAASFKLKTTNLALLEPSVAAFSPQILVI